MYERFVPLNPHPAGLMTGDIGALAHGRDIYIRGCGPLGMALFRNLQKNGLQLKGFCDNNPALHAQELDGYRVLPPDAVNMKAVDGKAFIIIASAQHRRIIEEELTGLGLARKKEFISHITICRPEAVINISGICSLACPSCPTGDRNGALREGWMTADVYAKVLDKLVREIPFLMNIDLSTWGEPLMNPDIGKIIRMTEHHVPCSISTNLQISERIVEVIEAQPSQMLISAGGYGRSYEENIAGASWDKFVTNLDLVRRCVEEHRPRTQVAVLYHLYRDNAGEDLVRMRRLCQEAGIKLITTFAYLSPYDKILDYCLGVDIGNTAEKVVDKLKWDLNGCLKLARRSSEKPCLCQRIFPIVNWDLSVALCHTQYHPVITDNFLKLPLNEIIGIRLDQERCKICQSFGLHRLDIDVLLKEYPKEVNLQGL